jgi:hypothetical protein
LAPGGNMFVESIQKIFTVWPVYTRETVYKTLVDPVTDKKVVDIVTYYLYNDKAKIDTNENNKTNIDVKV